MKQSNLLFFTRIFNPNWRTRIFKELYFYLVFDVIAKTSKLYYENTLFLLLILKEKYCHLDLKYKTIDFLTMRYDSAFSILKTINKFRKKIQRKD
jgi:hypothetical protein